MRAAALCRKQRKQNRYYQDAKQRGLTKKNDVRVLRETVLSKVGDTKCGRRQKGEKKHSNSDCEKEQALTPDGVESEGRDHTTGDGQGARSMEAQIKKGNHTRTCCCSTSGNLEEL